MKVERRREGQPDLRPKIHQHWGYGVAGYLTLQASLSPTVRKSPKYGDERVLPRLSWKMARYEDYEVANVKDFRAIGDNVADDTTAMWNLNQSWVDAENYRRALLSQVLTLLQELQERFHLIYLSACHLC